MNYLAKCIIILIVLLLSSESFAKPLILPESGKKIIETYLKKNSLSIRYSRNGDTVTPVLALHSDSIKRHNGGDGVASFNKIYQYMQSRNMIKDTDRHGNISLGEYRVRSIDKVQMVKKGDYNIYKVAFSFYPLYTIESLRANAPTFKAFSNLVYDRFKEQWEIKEDYGDVWSVAGNERYNLLEFQEDPFGQILYGIAMILPQTEPKHIFNVRLKNSNKSVDVAASQEDGSITLPDGRSLQVMNVADEVGNFIPGYKGAGVEVELIDGKKKSQCILLKNYPEYGQEQRTNWHIRYINSRYY